MKIFIDTNVLISAALFPKGIAYQAYMKAVSYPNHGVVCDQNIDELRRIFNRKFPNKLHVLEAFLIMAVADIEIISSPILVVNDENLIRDKNDRAILRAAEYAKAEILLTGDKDFLESGIKNPRILSPGDFLMIK